MCSKIYQTLQSYRMEDMEQPCFWKQVQFQNRIWVTILGSKTDFEFGPNLLGVQSQLERSDKFPKIIIFQKQGCSGAMLAVQGFCPVRCWKPMVGYHTQI
jgi:hypothetical protein